MNRYETLIRIIMAVVIGGLIGYEREYKNRPAGFRTHILVCLGACIVSLIQSYSFYEALGFIERDPSLSNVIKVDMGRLGAQVITGVGFLGAGTILRDKGEVKGLTTAASLWVVACIGLGVGMGYYFLTISVTLIVFIVLVSLKKFERRYMTVYDEVRIRIYHNMTEDINDTILNFFKKNNIKILSIGYGVGQADSNGIIDTEYCLELNVNKDYNDIINELPKYKDIVSIEKV
ncbi:MgtC/SapB family protein [Clostridium hydrogeniformans]|uniref:MgtC/SapB family protein n=1 Tax=Clostridium hydrogeniformans TaxID=349933 RepID=UPI000486E9A8|nr:MgtC/SapB family protein [Clostridium hydrogeniformans]